MASETAGKSEHERQEAEFRLRERERFLRMLISNLPGAVFRSRTDSRFTKEFIGDGCFDLTGFHAVELVGENAVTSWNDLIHAEDRERVFADLCRLIENEPPPDGDQMQISYRLICRDKQVRHLIDRFSFVRDSAGKVIALEGFTTNLTESRQAAESLRLSEARFRTLFNTIDEGCCIIELLFDANGNPRDYRILEVNPMFEKMSGLADPTGKTIRELIPDIEDYWIEAFGKAALTGEAVRFENRAAAINRWFRVFASRIGDQTSRKLVVVFTNITARRRAEMNSVFLAEIIQELERLTGIDEVMQTVGAKIGAYLNLSVCAFVEINEAANGANINFAWNRADVPGVIGFYRLSEWVSEEFQAAGRAGEVLIVRDTQTDARTDAANYAALKIGSFLSVPILQDGEWRFLLGVFHSTPHDWQADETALIRELTTLIWNRFGRAYSNLRVSENRYRLLAENMNDLVCLHELDGTYLYVSPSSETLLGYAPAKLVGTSPYDLFHPEEIERIRDEAHNLLLTGKTGIIIEYRMRDKKGEYCWFESMAQTVTAPDGTIVQIQTVSRDISNRKKAEAKTMEAQEDLAHLLFDEQKSRRDAEASRVEAEHANRAKDEFLQMVSHEFRTPLTTIKTLVRVLQHDGSSESTRQRHLETIAAECDRQIDMILNLLDVSRLEEDDADLKHEPTDINRILSSCDKIERPAAESRDQILTVEQNASLPKIAGDAKAIRRALCTIIENAIKYTPEGGIITVTARHVAHHGIKSNEAEEDKKLAAEMFGNLPKQMNFSTAERLTGEEVAIIVCDTGRGILPGDIPKLFGKFYRGKNPHHDSSTDGTPDDAAGKAETPGVGLGLYLAKRLITALDGRITVNSDVGRGSCFTVFLPVWEENTHEKDTFDEYGFDEEFTEKTPVGG